MKANEEKAEKVVEANDLDYQLR